MQRNAKGKGRKRDAERKKLKSIVKKLADFVGKSKKNPKRRR